MEPRKSEYLLQVARFEGPFRDTYIGRRHDPCPLPLFAGTAGTSLLYGGIMLKACAVADCLSYAVEGGSRCREHTVEQSRGYRNRRASAPGDGAARRLRAHLNCYDLVVCRPCRRSFHPSEIEVDHRVPLADGGTDFEDNVQGLCRGCHRDKTRAENSARAKRAVVRGR